jgi:hypothetical protein
MAIEPQGADRPPHSGLLCNTGVITSAHQCTDRSWNGPAWHLGQSAMGDAKPTTLARDGSLCP